MSWINLGYIGHIALPTLVTENKIITIFFLSAEKIKEICAYDIRRRFIDREVAIWNGS